MAASLGRERAEPWPQSGPLLPGLQSQARRQPWAAARTGLSPCPRQRTWGSPGTPEPPCTHCCTGTGSRWSPGTVMLPPPHPMGAVGSAPCPPTASGLHKGFTVQLGDLRPVTQTSQAWETSAAAPRASGRGLSCWPSGRLWEVTSRMGWARVEWGWGRGRGKGQAGWPWGKAWSEPSGSQCPFQGHQRLLQVDRCEPPGQPRLPRDALSLGTGKLQSQSRET